MVDPTIMATFLLLLRLVDGLEGGGGLFDCVGVEIMALEVAVVGIDVEAAWGVEVMVEEGVLVVLADDVVALDKLIADVVGLVIWRFDNALDIANCLLSHELLHRTGCCPSLSTMLKSLLTNVGGVALAVLRSDNWKWHTHALPLSRGTRMEPDTATD